MNRLTRKPPASTLVTAMALACCGLAACLSSTPITATGGAGGGGNGGSSSGDGDMFTTTSTFNGDTTASFSEPGSGPSGGDTTTGSDTTTSSGTTTGGDTTSGPGSHGRHWNFDKSLEGWGISYSEPKDLFNNTNINHDAGAGSPNPGAIHLSIPFNNSGQKLAVAIKPMPSLDLTGRQITAQVKLEYGLANNGKGQGVAKLYVKSGDSFAYADSGARNLTPGGDWISIPLTASNPEGYKDNGYNPADIREIGVEISTEGNGSYTAADMHIDSVGYD